jgi:uncharacterized membrane protein
VQIPIDPGEDFLSISEVMRLLLEIVVVAALIYFGWDTPFKEQVDQVRAKVTGKQTQVAPQELTPTPKPAPRIVPGIVREPTPPRGTCRLDPNHRSTLDAPVNISPSPHY